MIRRAATVGGMLGEEAVRRLKKVEQLFIPKKTLARIKTGTSRKADQNAYS